MQGSPSDLAQSGADFAKLVGKEENHVNDDESATGKFSRKSSIEIVSLGKTSNSRAGQAVKDVEQTDSGVKMEESSKGKVKGSISVAYFKSGAHWMVLCVLGISFLFAQILASGSDYWVSVW